MPRTKKQTKKDDVVDLVDESGEDLNNANQDTPTSVEAAYWDEKSAATASPKSTKTGDTRSVDEYVSNIVVKAKPNESSEQLLRRFNRQVRDLNLMDEIRDRLEYLKPSQKRKREAREKAVAARRRY